MGFGHFEFSGPEMADSTEADSDSSVPDLVDDDTSSGEALKSPDYLPLIGCVVRLRY